MNEFLHVLKTYPVFKIFEMIYQSSGIQIFIAGLADWLRYKHKCDAGSLPALTDCRSPLARSWRVTEVCVGLPPLSPLRGSDAGHGAAAQATLMHPGCSCSGVCPQCSVLTPASRATLAHSAVTTSQPVSGPGEAGGL